MQTMAERLRGDKYTPWKIRDKVWLSATNLRLKLPSRKLAPKRYGPFPIIDVLSPITFTLKLPPQSKIHPTFHASVLSSYGKTDVHGPNFPKPPPDIIEEEEEFEVEAILSHKGTGIKRRYLVSWKGYSSGDNEWLPEKNLKNSARILNAYKKQHAL
jgi:Chromo (CHRromatin Organisation MOdifier) domain